MHTLPAGKYFIGDPFLVISESHWDAFIDQFEVDQEQVLELNGQEIWVASTGLSDVSFTCQKQEYENVSGYYAVIPVELLEDVEDDLENLGVVAEFKRIFTVSTDGRTIDAGKYTLKPTVDDIDDFDEDEGYEELNF